MSKKKIGIIIAACVLAVIIIVVCIVIAVQHKSDDNEPAVSVGSHEASFADITEQSATLPAETVPETQNAQQTTAAAATTKSGAQTTAAPTTKAPTQTVLSMSTGEIVNLYNGSVNRVKSEAKSITRNYKKLESLDEYLELPSLIQSLGSAAIKQFVKGSDTPESWSTKDEINQVFPVGNTDYSSKMTADMVETASCTDTGSAYKIEIKLYNDKITSPAKGQGYAGVFNTVTASTFEDINIPTVTFNKVDINGINGSISCTIDKNTQRVTEITFRNTDIMAIDVKVAISNASAQIALAVEENYSIDY